MLVISLTFDWQAVEQAVKKPLYMLASLVLVFGSMAFIGWGLGRLFFGDSLLFAGQVLVGLLPTDVSAPLLVLLARGNVALAAVLNALVTGISPFLVPPFFLWLTGIPLEVPVLRLIFELALIILVPMILGVSLRSRYPDVLAKYDDVFSGMSGILYLLLLLAVVTGSATTLLSLGKLALLLTLAQLTLNLSGYALASMVFPWIRNRGDRVAFLFTVSKKEFSIAAAVVMASGLPEAVVIPAVFYAVIQMITSPLVTKMVNRLWS